MSNLLSYIVLFSFPFLAVILFNRLGATKGIIWTILAGYLFLPVRPVVELPIPGFPHIDKTFVPAATALILVGVALRKEVRLAVIAARRLGNEKIGGANPEEHNSSQNVMKKQKGWWVVNLLVVLAVLGPILTTLTNGEPLLRGGRVQSGFQLYDSGRAIITVIVMLMPFFLARKYLTTVEAHKALVWALVVAGLVYMSLSIYEVRMAPTLNRKLYGFFAHEWRQHVRRDGYRSILFLEHGLRVAIFLAMGILAVAVATRIDEFKKKRKVLLIILAPLFVAFWMAKSLGAFMIALIFFPIVMFFSARSQVTICAIFSAMLLLYPMLRGTGLVPVERIVSIATEIDEQRGRSLLFRLKNEEILLERASQKPLAGWGGQGRWLVLGDENGGKSSIPDGRWIITIGQYGWLGYLTEFGLLTLSILAIAWKRRDLDITVATGGLVLILTANLIDLIPNSGLTPVTWLIAGALTGWYERQRFAESAHSKSKNPRRTVVERKSSSAVRAYRA